MNARDSNGNTIHLPWPVLMWGIAMLVAVLAAWADMRAQTVANRFEIQALRGELAYRVQRADEEHARIGENQKDVRQRVERLEGKQ